MLKKLTHFSEAPLRFESARFYPELAPEKAMLGKPTGLWLSDETEDGWKKWCEVSVFHLEGLAHATDFDCDLTKWCILPSAQEILKFTKEYGYQPFPQVEMTFVNWDRVKKEFSGILISPYCWDLRLDPETHWYYGWDCASGCAWDLSTVSLR